MHPQKPINLFVLQAQDVNLAMEASRRSQTARVDRNCSVKFQPVGILTELDNDVLNGRSSHRNTWFSRIGTLREDIQMVKGVGRLDFCHNNGGILKCVIINMTGVCY